MLLNTAVLHYLTLYFKKIIFYSINENNFEERESRICNRFSTSEFLSEIIIHLWANVWNTINSSILKKDYTFKKCVFLYFSLFTTTLYHRSNKKSSFSPRFWLLYPLLLANKEKTIQRVRGRWRSLGMSLHGSEKN